MVDVQPDHRETFLEHLLLREPDLQFELALRLVLGLNFGLKMG